MATVEMDLAINNTANPNRKWALWYGSAITGTNAITADTSYIVVGVFATNTCTLRVNGVLEASAAPGTNTIGSGLKVLDNISNDGKWDGKIFELFICNGVASDADIEDMEDYLNTKWAIY